MTRLTFRVSALPFKTNMVLRQNALDFQQYYPRAAQAALDRFYVDDVVTAYLFRLADLFRRNVFASVFVPVFTEFSGLVPIVVFLVLQVREGCLVVSFYPFWTLTQSLTSIYMYM